MGSALLSSAELSLGRLGVERGEEIVLLTDTGTEDEVWRAFFDRTLHIGANPTTTIMSPRSANGLEPTAAANEALAHADVVLALTSASATHTKALKRAAENGARVCSLPGISADIMKAPVMSPDYEQMRELADRLMELLAPAMQVRVTTSRGTDLRIGGGGWQRMPMADDGTFLPGMIANLPAGEVLIVPWEGDSDGVLVVDLALSFHSDPLSAPVVVRFANGAVTEVEGGRAAERMLQLMEENGETSRNNAEFAIGVNPNARNTGVLIETEKQFGTAHVGIGNSQNIGGEVWAPIHIDAIFDNPTVEVDGRVILRDRQFDAVALRKESFDAESPLGAPRLRACTTTAIGGRLHVDWKDSQRRTRSSQVGDDQTASLAVNVLERLRRGNALTDQDRRVAAVMARYGVVESGETGGQG